MAPKDNVLEVDPIYEESSSSSSDEGYDGKSDLSTDSLTSSIYNYRYENGRRYHAYREGNYPLPNDEKEQDRLDIVHHIDMLLSNNRLYHAPLPPACQLILDVGTGTGIWAIDVAETMPSARVIGTDLSPIQPSWVPPNAEFQIEDAETDWNWTDKFDFIHIRCLNGSIKDWKRLLKQAYKHLKPGGWVEVDEFPILMYSDDGSLGKHSAMRRWCELFEKGIEVFGKNCDVESLGRMLREVGFEGVEEVMYKVPVGPWAKDKKQKELGAYYLMQAESGFQAYGMAIFTRVLGMPTEEAEVVVKTAEKECQSRKVHAYVKRFVFWGQKPEEEEEEEDEHEDE